MDKITGYLTELGLSKKEAAAYVALLEIGSGTAYAVAKQAGLKRPTVYLLLDELRKKDLVTKVPHAKNQIFTAKDPEEFFSYLEGKLQKAKQSIPSLLQKYRHSQIVTHLYEGKPELQKALTYRRSDLADKEMLAFYGIPRSGAKIPDMYYDHAKALQRQNTSMRVFAPDDESLRKFRDEDADYGQHVMYLPKGEYLPKVSVEVGPNFSKIFLHSASQALIIEGEEFSEFMRQVFELVWKARAK